MTASIATGPFASGRRSVAGTSADGYARTSGSRLDGWLGMLGPRLVGLAFVVVAIVVYVLSNPHRYSFYDHFVWQAQAWLDGSISIRYPVDGRLRTQRLLPGRAGPG